MLLNIFYYAGSLVISSKVAFFILKHFDNTLVCRYADKILKNNISAAEKMQKEERVPWNDNLFIESFAKSSRGKELISFYKNKSVKSKARLITVEERGNPDKIGDLIVFKKEMPENNEKGVILIKYNEAIDKFPVLYDINKIAKSYRIVLEPSWVGYQELRFLSYYQANLDIVVQSPHKNDFDFIKNLSENYHPIQIGAGDWCDSNVFYNKFEKKIYDLVMLGNWGKFKRHDLLFLKLSKIKFPLKVAVIGYNRDGRTITNVKEEIKKYKVENQIELFDSIKQKKVINILNKSKVSLLLSKQEGANRAIYESIFCNVPILVYKDILGINRGVVNSQTGTFASDDELNKTILYMLNNLTKFSPRKWALQNTGYEIATKKLNSLLKQIAHSHGEPWTRDIYPKKNAPGVVYANEQDYLDAKNEYKKLESYLRT